MLKMVSKFKTYVFFNSKCQLHRRPRSSTSPCVASALSSGDCKKKPSFVSCHWSARHGRIVSLAVFTSPISSVKKQFINSWCLKPKKDQIIRMFHSSKQIDNRKHCLNKFEQKQPSDLATRCRERIRLAADWHPGHQPVNQKPLYRLRDIYQRLV